VPVTVNLDNVNFKSYVGDKIVIRLRGVENAGADVNSDIEVDLLTISASPGNTVSGTCSLPLGGVDVSIFASLVANGTLNFAGDGETDLTIPAGMNAMSYSLVVPDVPGQFVVVSYNCSRVVAI